ncbi:MAG TPA: hypothetical protein VGA50_13075 [Kiloniellales bacterium]
MSRRQYWSAMLASALLLGGSAAGVAAESPEVHDGLTADELAAFAGRQGWRAEISGGGRHVTIYAGDKETRLPIVMLDCDSEGKCRAGLIQEITYYFLGSDWFCTLWHWNLEARGATGFGPGYVTLQRYLQFRGVTDQYLLDVVDAWLNAAPPFWAMVEECSSNGGRDRD